MFEKSVIIYLTKSRIWASQSDRLGSVIENSWNEEKLIKIIGQIRKKFKADNFKIILGGDISYAFTLIERGIETKRENILDESKKLLPQEVDNDSFDWQIVGRYEGENILVQVCGLNKNVLNILSLACEKNKVEVEFMLPCAILLAWQARKVDNPHLILWSNQENLAVTAQSGIVYDCQNLGNDIDSKVKEMTDNAKDIFNFKLNDLVLDVNKWEGVAQIFPGWQENHYELDPFLEMKNHNQGKDGVDEEVLELSSRGKMKENQKIQEISPENNPENEEIKINTYDQEEEGNESGIMNQELREENNDQISNQAIKQLSNPTNSAGWQEEEKKENKNWKKVIFIVVSIVVLVGLGIGLFFVFGNKKLELNKKTEKEETVLSVTVAESTPIPLDLSVYKVKVLNGSGIEGHATLGKETLEKVGFKQVETGNAKNYDFKETEINYKKEVTQEVVSEITKALSDYESTATASVSLEKDGDFDVVVTLGSKKAKQNDE